MITRTSFRALCLLAATLVTTACGSSDSDAKTLCQPGQQASCACPSGGQGAQVCRSDGSGWDACQGCSGAGGSGGGSNCASINGSWSITAHCQPSQVGSTVTVHQSGCAIDDVQPWTGWKGTVDSNGGISLSGPAGSSNMTCNGTVAGTVITMECTPPCSVKLTKN